MGRQLRTSFTVNGANCPTPDHLIQWVKEARPSTILVMDSYEMAVELYNAANGETKVCHRTYHPAEGSEWKTTPVAEYVQSLIHWGHPEIYRQVLNEPAIITAELPQLLEWLMQVMDALWAVGYRGVIGNFGVGLITPEQVEAGLFDDFLRCAHQYRGWHYIGIHEYTAITRYFGVGQWPHDALTAVDYFLNPENHTPDKWPTREGLPVSRINGALPPYWHIRRADWLTIRAREIGIPEDPLYWVTESGYDNNQDVSAVFPALVDRWGIAPGYDNLRGLNSLGNVWRAYWPQWTFDEAAYQQERWLDDECYPDNYIGWNNFMWTGDRWRADGFDMSQNSELLARLVEYAVELRGEPEPEPPQEPEPEPRWPVWVGIVGGVLLFIALLFITLGIFFLLARTKVSALSAGVSMETLQVMPVDEAGKILLAALMAILAGGMSSPITVPIVNLVKFILKRIGKENEVSGDVLAALIAAIITAVIWISRWAGIELEVNNIFDLLKTILPPALTFIGLAFGQKSLYSWAVRETVPAYGYQRSKEE